MGGLELNNPSSYEWFMMSLYRITYACFQYNINGLWFFRQYLFVTVEAMDEVITRNYLHQKFLVALWFIPHTRMWKLLKPLILFSDWADRQFANYKRRVRKV